MLVLPVALVMVILSLVFGDERAANIAAHEICPMTHVVRDEDDRWVFGCDGRRYHVDCGGGECAVTPL